MKLSSVLSVIEHADKHTFKYDGHEVTAILENSLIDYSSEFFVCGYEFGASWLIVANHFEDAWGAWVDSLPTIPEDELIEAYGPEGTPDGSFYDMAVDAANAVSGAGKAQYGSAAWDDRMSAIKVHAVRMMQDYTIEGERYPDLIEGYENQDNASGTGVVSMGHYAWMKEADLDLVEISDEEVSK